MRYKLMSGLMAAAALTLSAPAWAHGGHGNWKPGKHWHKHPVHQSYYHQPRHYVVREYRYPAPVYPAAVYPAPLYPVAVPVAPAPGIHVVLPNIYIPLR